MTNRLAIVTLALLLAACGQTADLEPQAGKTLPQKPALASHPLTAEQLLALPPQADPDRVDELNTKGAPRQTDRFDLPPPNGTTVLPPVGSGQSSTASTTGPENQDEPHR
jgi:Prokaryotic lipoprotein-attachment site